MQVDIGKGIGLCTWLNIAKIEKGFLGIKSVLKVYPCTKSSNVRFLEIKLATQQSFQAVL